MVDLLCSESISFADIPASEIESVECRFATYTKSNDASRPDLHVIKEVITKKNGEQVPNLRFVYDYQFPFWVTRKGFRNHQQPKEWEQIERLQQFKTTRRQKVSKMAAAIGAAWFTGSEKKLFEKNPYFYGADITSTAQIKKEYLKQFDENKQSFYSFAELDIETNLESEREEATMASIFMPDFEKKKSKLYTVVVRSFLDGISDEMALAQIKLESQKYLNQKREVLNKKKELKIVDGDYDNLGIEDETIIVENDLEMWLAIFKRLHEWQPDILSIWNLEFEMDKFVEMCAHYDVDPASIWCDPRIPAEYRTFEYIKGKPQKTTVSGKVMPIPPQSRWHIVRAPASFTAIDQMGAYKQTRLGEQEEPSYALGSIMDKTIKRSKLEVKEADHLQVATYDWHVFMQKHVKIPYIVYNKFDVIGPAYIEQETMDMRMTLPMMADTSDFENFPSQPRRGVDDLHWYVQEHHDRVIGVSSSANQDEYTDEVLDLRNWIITLPAALIREKKSEGIIADYKDLIIRIFSHVGD